MLRPSLLAASIIRSNTVGTPGMKVGLNFLMEPMMRSIFGAGSRSTSEPMSTVSVSENVRP